MNPRESNLIEKIERCIYGVYSESRDAKNLRAMYLLNSLILQVRQWLTIAVNCQMNDNGGYNVVKSACEPWLMKLRYNENEYCKLIIYKNGNVHGIIKDGKALIFCDSIDGRLYSELEGILEKDEKGDDTIKIYEFKDPYSRMQPNLKNINVIKLNVDVRMLEKKHIKIMKNIVKIFYF